VNEVLVNPALPRPMRAKLLEGLFKAASFDPLLANVLKLMNDRNRLDAIPMLVRGYRDLVDAKLGRLRGKVTSAVKLGDAQLASIRSSLEGMTKKTVLLESTQDKALLGGVVAQVGSRTFDGSLRTQLRELGQKLDRPNQ
jgi:F-type H+-transporting ATPase subunit delta